MGPPRQAAGAPGHAAGSSSTAVAAPSAAGGQEVRMVGEAVQPGHRAPDAKRIRCGDDDSHDADMTDLLEYGLHDEKAGPATCVHIVNGQDDIQEMSRIEEDCASSDLVGTCFVKIAADRRPPHVERIRS